MIVLSVYDYNMILVNKMKLKKFVWLLFCFFAVGEAVAATPDPGLRFINSRGKIKCGTNLAAPSFAFRDEEGRWKGFDVDICQAFSVAIFGTTENFEMVDVRANQINTALSTGKIDIMLGGQALSAGAEARGNAVPAAILYYDRQVFLGRQVSQSNSLEDYRFATACVVANSNDANNVEEFSNKHNLGLKMLTFNSEARAKQAFLLNRCQLLTGNQIYLREVWEENFQENPDVKLIPDVLALKTVYVLVDKSNPRLQVIARWVVNALQLAEMYGMNSRNINMQIGLKNSSQKNLLGAQTKLWSSFGLRPDWVKQALARIGNFGEIYERNFGQYSPMKIDRAENRYLKDGGLINPQPFL